LLTSWYLEELEDGVQFVSALDILTILNNSSAFIVLKKTLGSFKELSLFKVPICRYLIYDSQDFDSFLLELLAKSVFLILVGNVPNSGNHDSYFWLKDGF